jgi:outer membrane protein assembly complex protein YaeT
MRIVTLFAAATRLAILLGGSAAVAHAQTPAAADAPDAIDRLVGRTVTAIHLDIEGRRADTPDLLVVLEVKVNRPLDVAELRASMVQLQSAGRFEDVRVRGITDAGGGVELVFDLVPRHSIDALKFDGAPPGLTGVLEKDLRQRFNGLPPNAQVDAAARVAERTMADHGYRQAKVQPTVETTHTPDRATLLLTVDPGPLTIVTSAKVEGTSPMSATDILKRAGVAVGQPYRSRDIDEGLDEIIARLHERGYYDASASHSTDELSADGTSATVVLTVDAALPVTVQFLGDPLPGKESDLVPFKREGSVDDDLLEDAVRRIESALRRDGYWKGKASFARSSTPSSRIVTITVERGLRYRFDKLEVSGNTQMTTDAITALVGLEPDAPFDESRIGRAVAAISDFYRTKGFAAARVTATAHETNPAKPDDDPRVVESIVIEEGAQTTVSDVTVTGAAHLAAADILAVMRLKRGGPYVAAFLPGDRDAIRLKYDERGYGAAAVEVRVKLNDAATRAAVQVDVINEGPQTILDDVIIVGNKRVSTKTIQEALELTRGQPLGMAARLALQQRLSGMGFFRRVLITEAPHAGGSNATDLIITVEESPTTSRAFGGGLEAGLRARSVKEDDGSIGRKDKLEVAPRASAEVSRNNLFGKNRSVTLFSGVSLRPIDDAGHPERDGKCCGFSEYRVIGSFDDQRLFGWNAKGRFTVSVEQAIRNTFNFLRENTGLQVLRRVSAHGSFLGGYSLERVRLSNQQIAAEDQLPVDRLFPRFRLSVLSSGVARDTRDDPASPGDGGVLSADANLSMRAIGSELGFAKVFMQAFAYRRLPAAPRLVLAGGARVGLVKAFPRVLDDGSTVELVPASQRFFSGGGNTVRGFQQDQLGAPNILDARGLSNGGNAVMVLNAEIRTAITHEIGLATFMDTGNVFSRIGEVRVADLRTSLGAGVRYRSPVGPLRFDIGWKVGALRVTDGRRWEFHFSIGEAF